MTTTKPQCSERIFDNIGWGMRFCYRNGVVERDGKWYCRQHDPEVVTKRRVEQHALWEVEAEAREAKYAAERERYRRAALYDDLVGALDALFYHVEMSERFGGLRFGHAIKDRARDVLQRARGEA